VTHPEDLQDSFAPTSRRRTVAMLAAVALLLLAALAAARPCWNLIKDFRASQFLAEAHTLQDAGQIRLALERGRSALQLTPLRPDVLRFNADLVSHLGGKGGLHLWARLVETGHATDDDLASYAEAGLRLERADLVRDIASNIVARGITSPRGERIAALYFVANNDLFKAVHHARNAYASDPANPTNAVLLADLLLVQPSSADTGQARELLWTAARTSSALRTHAARKLASPPLGNRADREALVELLSAITNRSSVEDLLLIEARVTLDPSSSGQVISNVIASLPHNDLPRTSALADTLRRLGRHPDNLRLTSGGRAFRSPELFRARLEALLATGQIEEAYQLALDANAPLPPYDLELTRVRIAARTGDARRKDSHLRDLVRSAGAHPARLRAACELAEELKSADIAAEGWRILSQQPAEAAAAHRHLQRLADLGGDTWTARDHAAHAARLGDPDPSLQLQIAQYDLLLGEEIDRALGEAQRQVEAQPGDFHARTVLALAHLRQHAPSKARAALDRQVVDPSTLRPDTLAILAAVYGENGLPRRARDLARSIPLARLRPEERELLRPWLLPPPGDGGGDTPAHP
jgi:hypothetical protein